MCGLDRLGRTNLLGLFLLLGLAAAVWSSAGAVSAQGGLPTRPAVHTIATLHQGLRVYWYASSEDGGSAITGYEVQYRESGATAWTNAGHSGLAHPAVITGLRFNTSYEVRVRARNANGAGPWSSVETRRTTRDDGKPDRPWPPTLAPGDGRIEVSWNAPAYTGGRPITGYHVRYNDRQRSHLAHLGAGRQAADHGHDDHDHRSRQRRHRRRGRRGAQCARTGPLLIAVLRGRSGPNADRQPGELARALHGQHADRVELDDHRRRVALHADY